MRGKGPSFFLLLISIFSCILFSHVPRPQVLPIIELLSPTSPHIAKLRDFVSMQLPAGFPVKIELPVYSVLRARVTFGNMRQSCEDPEGNLFAVPPGYRTISAGSDMGHLSTEDRELMLALQASLREAGPDDVAMAYNVGGGGGGFYDEMALQRALAESLALTSDTGGARHTEDDADADLRRVMALSLAEAGARSESGVSQAHAQGPRPAPAGALPTFLQDHYRAGRGGIDEEDAALQQALAASLEDAPRTAEDEEEMLRRAIEASMRES